MSLGNSTAEQADVAPASYVYSEEHPIAALASAVRIHVAEEHTGSPLFEAAQAYAGSKPDAVLFVSVGNMVHAGPTISVFAELTGMASALELDRRYAAGTLAAVWVNGTRDAQLAAAKAVNPHVISAFAKGYDAKANSDIADESAGTDI